MILVDTGPFVALFDPQDAKHKPCKDTLKTIREPLWTTIPVLTEAFHLLTPDSIGADRLRDFILDGGLTVWFMDHGAVVRAFELMEQYRDHPRTLPMPPSSSPQSRSVRWSVLTLTLPYPSRTQPYQSGDSGVRSVNRISAELVMEVEAIEVMTRHGPDL
ncbi:MAG: type II toxin-antitoxin system VapC family toxin [Nitrospiraceae bacterium]